MKVVNNSERAIVIGSTLFVPLEPQEIDDTLTEHPRVKELFKLRDLTVVLEAEEVT